MRIIKGRNIRKYGHFWKWQKGDYRPDGQWVAGHWKSTSGNLVRIFPPIKGCTTSWWVVITPDVEEYEISGTDARNRAFAVAEAFTRQKRT